MFESSCDKKEARDVDMRVVGTEPRQRLSALFAPYSKFLHEKCDNSFLPVSFFFLLLKMKRLMKGERFDDTEAIKEKIAVRIEENSGRFPESLSAEDAALGKVYCHLDEDTVL